MFKTLLIFTALIVFTACGAAPSTGQARPGSLVHLNHPAERLARQLRGSFHSDCAEWSSASYHAYAISDYRFDQGDQYEQNTTYYLDSECKVLLSQYASTGVIAFDSSRPVFYFSPNGAEFRVFNQPMATFYDSESFCGSNSWRGQEWRDVMNKCSLGMTRAQALDEATDGELDLYPCEDPNREPSQCKVIRLKKAN